MADVQLSIIDGSDLTETRDGYEATRVAKVTGIDGATDGAVLWAALDAGGMPKRGDEHPTIPGIVVDTRQAMPDLQDPAVIRVVLTYRSLSSVEIADGGKPVMETGVTLTTEATSRDASGRSTYKVWQIRQYGSDGSLDAVTNAYELAQFERQMPQVVITFRRKMTTNPAKDATKYVGKVGSWDRADDGYAPWFCNAIRGTTQDGGASYDATYEFIGKPDGWYARIPRVLRTTDATGRPDLEQRDWLIALYEAVSFAPLGLPKPPDFPRVDPHGDLAPHPIPVAGPDA